MQSYAWRMSDVILGRKNAQKAKLLSLNFFLYDQVLAGEGNEGLSSSFCKWLRVF